MSDGSLIQRFVPLVNLEQYYSRPKNRYIGSNVGLKLCSSGDVHFDRSTINYDATLLNSDDSLTSLVTHTINSNSSYSFAIAQILSNKNILSSPQVAATSSQTAFNVLFRGATTANDIRIDTKLGLGLIGIISIKKQRYGDFIRATTLSGITTDGKVFRDACSASKSHGIITYDAGTYDSGPASVSAGYIFYDLGIISIHGPSSAFINSFSSIASIHYLSSIQITTLSVFCSSQSKEFNYSSNDSAFYNSSVTADPNLDSSTSNYNFTLTGNSGPYGFHWGENAATATHSNYYLRDFQNRNPYITTIGLYNDDNDLLLVGKCAQPIYKPKDVPLTFKIQYDF